MYVCICHGITDREISARIAAGARDVDSIRADLGCGATCGSCLDEVQNMLDEARGTRRAFAVPLLKLAA